MPRGELARRLALLDLPSCPGEAAEALQRPRLVLCLPVCRVRVSVRVGDRVRVGVRVRIGVRVRVRIRVRVRVRLRLRVRVRVTWRRRAAAIPRRSRAADH